MRCRWVYGGPIIVELRFSSRSERMLDIRSLAKEANELFPWARERKGNASNCENEEQDFHNPSYAAHRHFCPGSGGGND